MSVMYIRREFMKSSSNVSWLCFQFNSPSRIEVIEAFMRNERWKRVKLILISFIPCANSDSYAASALKTSRRVYKSKFGRFLKFHFYKWQYNWIYRVILKSSAAYVACYNGLKGVDQLVVFASRELNIPVLFFENAPLAGRMQIDWKGVNYDSSIPRNKEFFRKVVNDLNEVDWKLIPPNSRQTIKNKEVSQIRDIGGLLATQKYIFCPLQVPKDSQLTVHGGWIEGISHFLICIDQVSPDLPPGFHFRVKEHPSSKISFTKEIIDLNNPNIVLDNYTDTMDLVAQSRAVLTINSSVGMEAFYFEKPVITLGDALYSFDNLTSRATDLSQLKELVRNIEKLEYSDNDRDHFMRFLYSWFPTVNSILCKNYTLNDLNNRDRWLDQLISSRLESSKGAAS